MKLKNYAILLSILTAIEIVILVMSKQGIPIMDTSISKIGNLEGNYLFYILSTSGLIIMFSLFLLKIYKTLNHKPRKELYFVPIVGILGLFFKVNETITFGRITHTILFVLAGLLILIIVADLNTIIYSKKIKTIKKNTKNIPKIAFFGTVALFIIIGLNVITELVYIGAVLSWMNSVCSSI